MKGLTLCIVILTVCVAVTYQDKVPVLMWSNDRSLVLPHPLAGHTVSKDNFVQNYLNVIQTDNTLNVLLFIQDELSMMDITENAAVYGSDDEGNDALKQLKEIMSSMSVAQLPSVDSPLSGIAELKSRFPAGSVHELQPPYVVESLALSQSSHNLIIIRLPKLQDGVSSYRKYLKNIDSIVGSVTSQVKKLLTPFVAVYTAAASPDKEQSGRLSNMASKRSGRQLLQTTGSPMASIPGLIANVSGMFLLYASNITLAFGMQTYQLSTNYQWEMDASRCTNSSLNCTVVMTYANGSENIQLMISSIQTTGSNGGYWYVSAMAVNSSTTGPEPVYFNPAFMELTPVGYSWHCYPTSNISALNASTSTTGEYWTIGFTNLQIQAFGLYPEQGFGYYNDCTCFFSIAIWMGIIAGAVLLAILLFGVCMLMDIKTMDRFDDPKGKTITVAAAD